jgi:hypothetical protein
VAALARDAAPALAGLSDRALYALTQDIVHLPATDPSLRVVLGDPLGPEIDALRDSIAANDPQRSRQLLAAATTGVDTPGQRLHLAQALVALRGEGAISTHRAAAALRDLDSDSTLFVSASLVETLIVVLGARRTPGYLHIAA